MVDSEQHNPKYKNCEEDHVYTKLDHPTLLVSVEISENFSDINKMLPSNKQNSMIAGKRNCQQKQDPVASQEQKKAEYSLQNKLSQYPPVDVSRRHERIHLVNLQVR